MGKKTEEIKSRCSVCHKIEYVVYDRRRRLCVDCFYEWTKFYLYWKEWNYVDKPVPEAVWHRLFNKWVREHKTHETFLFR